MVPQTHPSAVFDPSMPLDEGIEAMVLALRASGIDTYESCEGGPGHAFPEPTVRFSGNTAEGFKAYAAAVDSGLPVVALRRVWRVTDHELHGPWWELTFAPTRGWWPNAD